jgi:hypothetical protein
MFVLSDDGTDEAEVGDYNPPRRVDQEVVGLGKGGREGGRGGRKGNGKAV